jgi:hypothetical protein
MSAAEDHRGMDPETAARFAHIEGMLAEIIRELRGRKARGAKRSRTLISQRRAEITYEPSDLDIAHAKKIMRRLGMKT